MSQNLKLWQAIPAPSIKLRYPADYSIRDSRGWATTPKRIRLEINEPVTLKTPIPRKRVSPEKSLIGSAMAFWIKVAAMPSQKSGTPRECRKATASAAGMYERIQKKLEGSISWGMNSAAKEETRPTAMPTKGPYTTVVRTVARVTVSKPRVNFM